MLSGSVCEVACQKFQDYYNVGSVLLGQSRGYAAAYEYPERLLYIKWAKRCFLFTVQSLLLVKGQ